MEDVYFTKRDLDNSIDTGNAIDKLMRNPKCRILVDLDNDTVSKMTDDSSSDMLFTYLQEHSKTFYSGKEMVTAIKESVENRTYKLCNGFSRSLVLLNEKDIEFAQKVERHFGIKCVLGAKKGLLPLKDGKAPFFEEKEEGSWDKTFSGVSAMPCNAIIINDHFLKGDNGTKNLTDIIRNLSKQRAHDVPLHILVIYSGLKGYSPDRNHIIFREQAEKTAKALCDELDKEMNYLLEYVYCDDTNPLWKLYKYTHDRFAISNYTTMDASHALELFNEGIVKTEQKVTVGNLFYEDTLKMNNTFIRRIADEIQKGIKNPEKTPYKYIRYDIVNGELKKGDCSELREIQNRFIMDELNIKEGEHCYYLSVPYDNDWAGTEILDGYYVAANYTKCIVARTKEELKEKKSKLQQLFINPSKDCEVPENDDDKYWRVIVTGQSNLKTVHAKESEQGEKVCNQVNNYLNNCFKYEEDAWHRVAEIKAVLGIE